MDSPGGGGSGSTISRRRRMQLHKQHSKENKEFVYAETFRPQRQPPPPGCENDPDTPLEDRPLLSSARPLVAPREKIQRTPSREVDPETESNISEPQPTPVSVVGPAPPKFMVEIASPTTAQSSGFFIENITSRATVSASVPGGSSPPVSQVTVTNPSIEKPIIIPPPTILSSSVTPPVVSQQQSLVRAARAAPQQATPPTVAKQPMTSPVAMQPTMAPPAAAAPAATKAPVAKPAPAAASCENAVLTMIQDLPYQTLGPFIALICGGGFISAATQLDPTWLVLLTSLASFILFRVLRI